MVVLHFDDTRVCFLRSAPSSWDIDSNFDRIASKHILHNRPSGMKFISAELPMMLRCLVFSDGEQYAACNMLRALLNP